jgi:hypothetical protein
MLIKKGRTIVCDAETTSNFFTKFLGLMFRKSTNGLLMKFTFNSIERRGIWMPFMRFPIDIVYIDSKKSVAGLVERAPPMTLNPRTWKVFYPEKPAKYILELPAGAAKKAGLEMGDVLEF